MWVPATALLWECWRLSRWYLVVLMFIPTLIGATILFAGLVVPADQSTRDIEQGPTMALVFAMMAGLVGGGWAAQVDNRRGFALSLGFARPIPTWVLVSVPMAYIGVACAVTYLVPVLALRTAFGVPFPLAPVAASVSTLALVLLAAIWWTGDPTRQRLAWAVPWIVGWFWYFRTQPLGHDPSRWSEILSFSAGVYGLMALAWVVAIGVTIFGVARQRRGDDRIALAAPTAPRAKTRTEWMFAGGLAMPCPISSPTRAQLWFEMTTAGRTVLKYGAMAALVGPAVISAAVPPANLYFFMLVMFVVPPIAGLLSILDVQRKHGSSSLGVFVATRAMGTARLVGLKVLATSLSLLAAWVAVGTSMWIFGVRLAVWGPDLAADLASITPQPTYVWVATVVGVVVASVTAMATGLTLHAMLVLNARRVILSGTGLGVCIALSVGAAAVTGAADAVFVAFLWIGAGAAVLGTAVLFRRLIAERIFTSRAFVVLGTWVVIALVVPDPEAWFVFSCLPLTVAALAPWSFSRLRHR